ncbi:heterochromatin protein 1-binding protein 3-like [Mytilus edulis]|uniref:heterochromatin protein 1-binding protein 3-like n=1 Tax=Mytilus edulis TaxID=6550 RepID=UPI0039F0FB3C
MPSIKLKKKTQEYLAEKERSKQLTKEPEEEKETEIEKNKKKDVKPKKKEKPPVLEAEVPVILEKRKRTVPPGEQQLTDWLTEHVESREGASVSYQTLFEYFTDFCAQQNIPVTVDPSQFNRDVKDKFGKEFGIKESSPYKGLIREIKAKPKSTKPKAESLTMKMRDIVEEILKETGNPTNGVRFPNIKVATANKYPALQVDLQPHKLLQALERGVYYGRIELVKGTGKCGFYRIFGAEPREDIKEKEEKEKEKEKQKKEEKLQKKKERKESEKENKEGDEEPVKPEEETPKKKGTKRKLEEKGDDKKGDDKKGDVKKEEEPQKKKKKKRHIKKPKWEKTDPHSNPEKIDDTFPLAFTYCSEPKEASFGKIKKYLVENYPSVNAETRLKPAIEKGIEKGIWEQSSGNSVGQGSYRLLLDDFDPESSKTIDDMICQAIVASHEPKQSTVIRIKQYIMDYHPDFNIESRPHKFKTAMERALKNGVIRQITGIGMSGTFQLAKPFIPPPRTLAGVEDLTEEWIGDEGVSGENYVVRKTKSGRYAGRQA